LFLAGFSNLFKLIGKSWQSGSTMAFNIGLRLDIGGLWDLIFKLVQFCEGLQGEAGREELIYFALCGIAD